MTSLVILAASLLVFVHTCPLYLDALSLQEPDEASGEDKRDRHPVSTTKDYQFQEKRTVEGKITVSFPVCFKFRRRNIRLF